mmetsp:Transcript_53196/g.149325  ORF Transcript_53196/g.149325 Transcript_53196/m.149325 type:complete len:179 (+) Transcript_53196:104-640(+)
MALLAAIRRLSSAAFLGVGAAQPMGLPSTEDEMCFLQVKAASDRAQPDCTDLAYSMRGGSVTCGWIESATGCWEGLLPDDAWVYTNHFTADDGMSPIDACCACGGGSNPAAVRKRNEPEGWRDRHGLSCWMYAYQGRCVGGAPAVNETLFAGWVEEGDPTALDVCAACGGGGGFFFPR